jgi:gliding motility-associated-like protein
MKKSLVIIFSVILTITGKAQAQIFATLAGYPLSTTGWTVGGDATTVDSEIELTGPSETQSGYVYYSTPVDLTTCSQFTVEFDFQIIPVSGTPVADGIAFWYISNPPSGFATGGGIGLPSNPNGLITILDSYNNNGLPDDNPLETLLYYNGTVPSYVEGSSTGVLCPVVTYQSFITDGSWHHCKMTYIAGNINVYFNYSTTASLTAYHPISITGYFGFSSSTGLYYSTQSIKDVSITSVGVLTAPTVTSPVSYCQYAASTALTASGSPLYWFPNSTDTAAADTLVSAPTPSTTDTGTTYYYVREGSGTCQSPADSIAVIVSAQPAAPVISGDTVYCTGSSPTPFTVTGSGIMWYTTATGGSGSATAPTVNTSVPGTYTYYASQSTSGCESARDSIKVVVHGTPAAPVLTSGQNIYCQYATFIPFTASGTDLLWYTTATGGTGDTAAPVINTATSGTYNYYVSQTDSGCESPRLSVPVTVNAKPNAPVLTAPVYCQLNTSIPLTATGTDLIWYGPGIISSGTTTAPTPSTDSATTLSYYVTQTILGCTSDSTMDAVVIKPKPAAPATTDIYYCQYATATALTAGGSNLQWYLTPTGSYLLGYTPVPATTTPGDSTWYVTQTVDGCISNSSSLTVDIIYLPSFSITPSAFSLCQFDSINLSFNGASLNYPGYQWALPVGAHTADSTYLSGTPSIVVQFDSVTHGSYVYLTATDDSGKCSTTDSVKIKVVAQPVAHSYIKPNVCVGDTIALALASESADATLFMWRIDGTLLNSSNKVNIISANSNSGGPYDISWIDTGIHVIQLNTFTQEGCPSLPSYDTVDVHALPNATFTYTTRNGGICLEDSVLFKAADYNEIYAYRWAPENSFNNTNSATEWGRLMETPSIISLTVTDPFGCAASTDMTLDPGTCCTIGFPSAFTPGGTENRLFRPIFAGYHNFHDFRIVNRWGQTVFESATSTIGWDGSYNGVPQDMGVYYYYIQFDCGGNTVEQKGDVTLIR